MFTSKLCFVLDILNQNTGDEKGRIFTNFELFPEFNNDVHPKLVNNNFNEEQQPAEIASFAEENSNDYTFNNPNLNR